MTSDDYKTKIAEATNVLEVMDLYLAYKKDNTNNFDKVEVLKQEILEKETKLQRLIDEWKERNPNFIGLQHYFERRIGELTLNEL